MSGPFKGLEILGRRALFSCLAPFVRSGEASTGVPGGTTLRRILLLRQDRIGDMVMTLPLLRRLRELHPGSVTGVVCSPSNRIVLKHEDGFHQIEYGRSPGQFLRSLHEAAMFRPDAAVDMHMHDSTTSFIYGAVSGAHWNLHVHRKNVLPFNTRVKIPGKVHVMEAFAHLLGGLGRTLSTVDLDTEITLSEEELTFAHSFKERSGVSVERMAGINISAGGENRWWGVDRYIRVCRGISETGLVPVVLSSPEHSSRARAVAEGSPSALLPPVTPTVLHLAALLRGMVLLVSPDTAAVHVAASMGVPVVGMYLKADPSLPSWEPWGVPYALVCSKDGISLDSVRPDDVLDRAAGLLKG